VRRFLWDDEVIPPARTAAIIDQSQQMFGERRCGLWGVWTHDSPDLVGFCGLWPFRNPPEIELLFGVAEQHWGRGHAVEIADAIVRYAFESLEMPVVHASTDAANVQSVRVLEKLGFAFGGRETIAGLDTVFYERQRG
jgi:ribosomal-protein-alanine N-acetyltransferase